MIDDYVFCEAIGKSGKQVYMVLKKINNERYLGGSLAIINNIDTFLYVCLKKKGWVCMFCFFVVTYI